MKKARMNNSHYRFILSKLKIFGEIVTTKKLTLSLNPNLNPNPSPNLKPNLNPNPNL